MKIKCAVVLFLLVLAQLSAATRWFVSNSTGQALRLAFSFSALRERYALSIMDVENGYIPAEYRSYYNEGWIIELRSLYEDGQVLRNQWVFMDEAGTTRFVAVKSPNGAGFIEIYNEQGLIIEDTQFETPVEEEDSEGNITTKQAPPFIVRYTYKNSFLLSARSGEWVDTYRYTHNNQIRAIDRRYFETARNTRVTMPRNPMTARLDDPRFVRPASSYTSSFLSDVLNVLPASSQFRLDNKGRIITETRRNAAGNTIGVLTNTWDGDRVIMIEWESEDKTMPDRRVISFIYNSEGKRVKEENWRNGVLERDVITENLADDTIETETLYIDEQPVLRAVWKNGKKTSEEPLDRPWGRPH